jgi:hypothetical protein
VKELNIVLLDGKHSNNFAIMHFAGYMKIDPNIAQTDCRHQVFYYQFTDFNLQKKAKCFMDLVLEKDYLTKDSSKISHRFRISPTVMPDGATNPDCMPQQTQLVIETHNVNQTDINHYLLQASHFSLCATLIMCALLYNLKFEDKEFT